MIIWKNPVTHFCLFFLFISLAILPTGSAYANGGGEGGSSSGAATYSVPIEVPPGRNGIAPNLALRYNSYQKNGWIGVGWNLDMGTIQRSTKWGVDYSADDYVMSVNGSSSELVARDDDWGQDYYGAKIESVVMRTLSVTIPGLNRFGAHHDYVLDNKYTSWNKGPAKVLS